MSMAQPAATKKSLSTKATLLAAARSLMIEHDIVDVSLSNIADRAQANSALVKYYFGNKEGLLYALLEADSQAALTELGALIEMPMAPVKKMRVHLEGTINTFYRAPYLNRLLQAMTRDASPDRLQEISDKIVRPTVECEAQLLRQGIESGDFYEVDPNLFYFMVLGACDSIYSSRFTLHCAFGIDTRDMLLRRQHIDQTVDILMRGIMRP